MKDADAPAVVAPWGIVSYAALHAQAEAWAAQIRSIGIDPGEVVALRGPASVAFLAALLGAWRAGAWAMPVAATLPKSVLLERVELTRARVLDVDALAVQLREVAVGEGPLIADMGGVLVATSGSSGAPKLAMLTTRALVANARRSNENIPVGPGARWLLSLPLFHVSGLGVLLRAWLGGGAVALPSAGQALPEAIATLRPTHMSLVATQLYRLMRDDTSLAQLPAMQALLLGGSAVPRELIKAAHEAGLPIFKSYGLSEAASQVATTRAGASLDELFTSGWPLAPDTLRISAEGEIEIRGETLFRGYWRAGGETHPLVDADGWYATGDLGHFDAKGRLVVLGRRDSMFISGGENIHPEAVERILAGLPEVEQALVVPVPDAEFVTIGVAFVAMSDGGAPDADAIRGALKAVLAGFQVPRQVFPWPVDLVQTGIKPNRRAFAGRAEELLRSMRGA